jgi:hypothetical protein
VAGESPSSLGYHGYSGYLGQTSDSGEFARIFTLLVYFLTCLFLSPTFMSHRHVLKLLHSVVRIILNMCPGCYFSTVFENYCYVSKQISLIVPSYTHNVCSRIRQLCSISVVLLSRPEGVLVA